MSHGTHQNHVNHARPTINDIMRLYGPDYLKKYADQMPADQIKALRAMIYCRTTEAGTAVFRCSLCDKKHEVPKSCGNRNCPTCQGGKAKAWLEKQLSQLLPCHYFMVTFTVPAEFRPFARSHPKECYKALFKAAYATMVKLAKDPKFIGSTKIGMTGVLHTWGRDVGYNPHVHFIVPGGALGADGKCWLSSRTDFFVPVKAASTIFRAKYRHEMKRCNLLESIAEVVWSRAWNVNSQAVGEGRTALKYLAPYVFRIAIGNHRIVSVTPGTDGNGHVVFLVKRSGTNRYRTMTVSAEEFIRRFLQHVLPKGFQKVRHFGFAHPRAKTNWEWLVMLVTVTVNLVYVLTVTAKAPSERPKLRCPECGGELVYVGYLPYQADPNTQFDTS